MKNGFMDKQFEEPGVLKILFMEPHYSNGLFRMQME